MEARNINQIEFERIVNKYLFADLEKLENALADKSLPMLERLVGNIILKGAKRGDVVRAEWVLNRTLGKVRDRLQVSTTKTTVSLTGKIEAGELSLANPNLTMAQLEAFEQKLDFIRTKAQEAGLTLPPDGGGARDGSLQTIDVDPSEPHVPLDDEADS